MLGTNVGSVHKQRQGTGYATILQGDDLAVKDFLIQDDKQKAAAAAGAAAKKKAADDAMKALTEFNPERWLKHDKEIQSNMDQWISEGAKLINAGVNPANSMDPASIAWRRKKAEIEAMSKASMQMKDMFTATRGKIDGSEADKYDPDSLGNMKTYFDMPISDIVKSGILPPPLLQAKPGLNLQKTWAGLSKDLYDRKGDKPLDEAGRWDFVRASMANDPEVEEAAMSYFQNLPKSEQDSYNDRAKREGKSVSELVNYDFLKRYEPGKEPFDLNKFVQQGVDSIDVPYTSYQTPTGFGKSVDKKEFDRIATNRAQVMLTNPEALYEYNKLLPMNPGETEGVYRARAVADLARRLKETKATSTESGITERGQGEKDMMVSAEQWLRDIKSGDPTKQERASAFLFETKGVLGNMNVARAWVTSQYQDEGKPFSKSLVVKLEGAPSLQKVEEQMIENGFSKKSISFNTVGTETEMVVTIDDQNENALLRLHDKAFKTGSRKYDPTPLQWSADDILKQSTPAPAKPVSKF